MTADTGRQSVIEARDGGVGDLELVETEETFVRARLPPSSGPFERYRDAAVTASLNAL